MKQDAFKLKERGRMGADAISTPPLSTLASAHSANQANVSLGNPPKAIVRSDTFKKNTATNSIAAFAAKAPAKKKKKGAAPPHLSGAKEGFNAEKKTVENMENKGLRY